jgi:predicted flap endonuclease-1-like 5' DNA nuclease
MAYEIKEIQGIGPAYAEKLAAANIATTEDLLSQCATPQGRKKVAEVTGLNEGHILKWTNLADLMRISGVGPQYSELLEGAGVDTVKELRNRNAENLATKMAQVNEEKHLSGAAPTANVVQKWVDQAKKLDPKVSY